MYCLYYIYILNVGKAQEAEKLLKNYLHTFLQEAESKAGEEERCSQLPQLSVENGGYIYMRTTSLLLK